MKPECWELIVLNEPAQKEMYISANLQRHDKR